MPSTKDPGQIDVGAGKLHSNVATAAADFQTSSGTSSMLAAALAALNQQLPVVTRTAGFAGTGQTSIVLDGSTRPIWLGDGTVSVSINDYFRLVTDPYEDVPTEADGSPVILTGAITGGSLGGGWYTGASLTLHFSGPITGGFWRIYYGTRQTLQTLEPNDPFTYTTIRNTAHVQENLADVLRDLHQASGNRDWDDAWESTIADLARSGLNERYRLSTTGLSGGTVDTAGEGAVITRDGQAPTVEATADFGVYFYPAVTADPYTAHFLTRAGPGPQSDTNHRVNTDGGTGYVGILQQRLSKSAVMRLNALAYTQASRMDLIERAFSASTIGTANVRTKVTPGYTTDTRLNPDAGTGFDDRREILLGTTDYFYEGTAEKTSEVAVGRDMIEITYPSGDKIVCVITALDASTSRKALVENLTGGGLSFPSGVATTGVSFRFIKTKYWQGVGSQQYTDFENGYLIPDGVKLGQLYHAIPPFVTDDIQASGGNEVEDIGDAEFFARAQTIGQSEVASLTAKPYALKWGGHDPKGWVNEVKGGLRGDGVVEATQYNIGTRIEAVSAPSGGAWPITWHPSLEGSRLVIRLLNSSGTAAVTLTLAADYLTNVVDEGDEIEVVVINSGFAPVPDESAPSGALYTIAWPSEFQFSGGDGTPVLFNHNGRVTVQKYKGTYDAAAFGQFLMTKTTYMGPGA